MDDKVQLVAAVPDVVPTLDDERDSERRILMAAVELVDRHGETGLRISDLVTASGRSVGSIYHFFDGREGVIEAVRAYRFFPTWDEDMAYINHLAAQSESLDELLDSLELVLAAFFTEERDDVLWRRVESIAAARTRPSLRHVLATLQRTHTAAFEDMLRELQHRGVVGQTVEVHAAAVFLQAFTLGRVLSILEGSNTLTREDWISMARRAVEGVLRG